MKSFAPLILLFISLGVNAQDVKKLLTSGKWYVAYTQEAGAEPEKADNKNDEWIVFLPNGKTKEEHFGDGEKAAWKYSNKVIHITGVEEKIKKIIEITAKKMVVEVIESGEDSVIVTYIK